MKLFFFIIIILLHSTSHVIAGGIFSRRKRVAPAPTEEFQHISEHEYNELKTHIEQELKDLELLQNYDHAITPEECQAFLNENHNKKSALESMLNALETATMSFQHYMKSLQRPDSSQFSKKNPWEVVITSKEHELLAIEQYHQFIQGQKANKLDDAFDAITSPRKKTTILQARKKTISSQGSSRSSSQEFGPSTSRRTYD